MILHVEHAQAMSKGTAWCGVAIQGPRLLGLEGLAYHSGTGEVCEACFRAIVIRLQSQLGKKV